MPPITILTDSAAEFVHKTYTGDDLVKVIPLSVCENPGEDEYRLQPASDHEIQVLLQKECQNAGHVIAILSSGSLSGLPNQILRLIKASSVSPTLVMIDTASIGLGTGFLVEKAARLAMDGMNWSLIEQTIREDCSMLYTTAILPDIHPLVPVGLVDQAQANAASILGIQSIFSMEEGLPTPLGKVRNRRSAYEYLVEFIDEFERFHLIAIVHEGNADSNDLQVIKDHLNEFFPGTVLQQFSTNTAWKTIFGAHSYGMVIISNEDNR